MKLYRQGHRRISASDQLFNQSPEISWDIKRKEIELRLNGIRTGPNSFHDFWVYLSGEELQAIVGVLATQLSNSAKSKR